MGARAVRRTAGRRQAAGALVALLVVFVAPQPAHASSLDLPVPKVTIYPGDVIVGEMVAERAFVAHTVTRSSVFDARQAVVGKVARRTLLPGQPIPVNAVRDAFLVNQGKPAQVVFEHGGLSISTQALALQNGGPGDVVSLRNLDSGATIKGTVEPDGTVRLGGP